MTSFAFETLIQDPGKAIPGTWESLLYKKAKDLRVKIEFYIYKKFIEKLCLYIDFIVKKIN